MYVVWSVLVHRSKEGPAEEVCSFVDHSDAVKHAATLASETDKGLEGPFVAAHAIFGPGEELAPADATYVTGTIGADGIVIDKQVSAMAQKWPYELIHAPSLTPEQEPGKTRVLYRFYFWSKSDDIDAMLTALSERICGVDIS